MCLGGFVSELYLAFPDPTLCRFSAQAGRVHVTRRSCQLQSSDRGSAGIHVMTLCRKQIASGALDTVPDSGRRKNYTSFFRHISCRYSHMLKIVYSLSCELFTR